MTPKLTLDAIESLIRSVPQCVERERWQDYATIKALTDDLYPRARGVPVGPLKGKMVQLLTAAQELAELEPAHGGPNEPRPTDHRIVAINGEAEPRRANAPPFEASMSTIENRQKKRARVC